MSWLKADDGISTSRLRDVALPTLTDWTQPQTVAASQLVTAIAQANAAGYKAHHMTVETQTVYRLTFIQLDRPRRSKCVSRC